LEADSRFSEAEYHFIQAEEWKGAVHMYRVNDMWEDAYRVGAAALVLLASHLQSDAEFWTCNV